MTTTLSVKSVLSLLAGVFFLASCDSQKEASTSTGTANSRGVKTEKVYATESGLQYEFKKLGEGQRAKNGDIVTVHYVGRLTNGTKFDSSYDNGSPYTFELGAGKVIKGWDEGIALLSVGDKAILTIPPQLGYGNLDLGVIAPNSTLVFEVELIDIEQKQ